MSSDDQSKNGEELNTPETEGNEAATSTEEELKKELEKARNDYLYLRAEFDNYRKQVIKERSDLLKYGAERMVLALLDVVDNFDRALSTEVTAENVESFRQGVALTAQEFHKALESFGVRVVECDGQPFDPSIHEALSSEETDRVPEGHITQVFRQAYKLHDRIIRPAQVVVAKAPSAKSDDKENQ